MTEDSSIETSEREASAPANQPAAEPATIAFSALPTVGAELRGGLFVGITTRKDGTHAAVILLPNKAQEELTWKTALAWAAEIGGELPARPVAALLFANAPGQFEKEWHWTSEAYGGSDAWMQSFYYGCQYWGGVGTKGCARAVRMIPLVL